MKLAIVQFRAPFTGASVTPEQLFDDVFRRWFFPAESGFWYACIWLTVKSSNVNKPGDNASFLEMMMRYNHVDTSREDKRLIAVTAALELIRCDATGGNAELSDELKNVAKYADQIQQAMKP